MSVEGIVAEVNKRIHEICSRSMVGAPLSKVDGEELDRLKKLLATPADQAKGCGSTSEKTYSMPVMARVRSITPGDQVRDDDGNWKTVQDVESWEDHKILLHVGVFGRQRHDRNDRIEARRLNRPE